MKVLITCGPTWVPVDDVRVISNVSSGRMGHLIAQGFSHNGDEVTLIEGPVTDAIDIKKIRILKYQYFDELAKLLKKECRYGYDVIIHASAVSDFRVSRAVKGKLSSSKSPQLSFVATPKLINDIKIWAPNSLLVGFKLEPNISKAKILSLTKGLFAKAQCDLVVLNSIVPRYKGYAVNADQEIMATASRKEDMAVSLVRLLS